MVETGFQVSGFYSARIPAGGGQSFSLACSVLAGHSFPTDRFSFLCKEKKQIEKSQEVLIETNKSV